MYLFKMFSRKYRGEIGLKIEEFVGKREDIYIYIYERRYLNMFISWVESFRRGRRVGEFGDILREYLIN